MYNSSVCLERKFEELKTLTDEELKNEVLHVLNSVGYAPTKIELGEANKGVIGEVRVPVCFDEKEAISNWHIQNKSAKN